MITLHTTCLLAGGERCLSVLARQEIEAKRYAMLVQGRRVAEAGKDYLAGFRPGNC